MRERTVTHQRAVEDLLGDRLAAGYAIARERLTGGDPQGARLPDRRRAASAPGGRRGGAGAAGVVLRRAGRDVRSASARCCSRRSRAPGFACWTPQGAYYIMADIGELGFRDDFAAADFFLDAVGVAAVPGSSFYHRNELGPSDAALHFFEERSDLGRGGRAPRGIWAKSWPHAAAAEPAALRGASARHLHSHS